MQGKETVSLQSGLLIKIYMSKFTYVFFGFTSLVSFVLASDQFKLLSGKFPNNSDSSLVSFSIREVLFLPHLKMIQPYFVISQS